VAEQEGVMSILTRQKPEELRKLHWILELSGMAIILYTIVVQVVWTKHIERLDAKIQTMYHETMGIYIENELYKIQKYQFEQKSDLTNLSLRLLDTDRAIKRIDTISRLCSEVFVATTRDEVNTARYRCEKARELVETLLEDPEEPTRVHFEDRPLLEIERPKQPKSRDNNRLYDIIWAMIYAAGTVLLMWAKYIERVHLPRLKAQENSQPAPANG
jgi:hypothetical protein